MGGDTSNGGGGGGGVVCVYMGAVLKKKLATPTHKCVKCYSEGIAKDNGNREANGMYSKGLAGSMDL